MTQQMQTSLIEQLQLDIALANCLNVVGHLRALQVLQDAELRILFLQARNVFLEKVCASQLDKASADRRWIGPELTDHGRLPLPQRSD